MSKTLSPIRNPLRQPRRLFLLGQPVVVVPFIDSGGWQTLEERTSHLATTVEVPAGTKGMVVKVVEITHGNIALEIYKILWETEKVSWHHSSLILPIDTEMALAMDASLSSQQASKKE